MNKSSAQKNISLSISILLFLILWSTVSAQTQRFNGQVIKGNSRWSGTIIIAGDIIIEKGSRLEIEPGTNILFEAGKDLQKSGDDKTRCELIVKGTLIARGLPGKRITFSSKAPMPRMGDWYGLRFLHLKTGSIIEYCVVEYAYNGISIKNSTMLVSNCEIRYNYHAGINSEVKAKPTIKNNILSDNGYAGIICELGAKPILTENLISLNRIGVVAYSLSQPNLGSLSKDDNYNPGKNHIFKNEEYNFYNHSTKTISAENNSWDNDTQGSIIAKVYDRDDNSKYGPVDFRPILRKSNTQGLNGLVLLTQNPASTDSNAINNPSTETLTTTGVMADTIPPNISQNAGNNLEEIEGGRLEANLEEAIPLIASNAPSSQILPTSRKVATQQIDYDQIFLELFLDGGKKEYQAKPKFKITNVLKNVLEPGEIRIRVIVARSGKVDQATILKGLNDILDQAILETVKNYRYRGGTVNGQSVKYTTSEVFRFE